VSEKRDERAREQLRFDMNRMMAAVKVRSMREGGKGDIVKC
jgi:hypothetical protein